MPIENYPPRKNNLLEALREQMAAHPDVTPLVFTPAQIEELLRRDGWSLRQIFPLSASNPNNPTIAVQGQSFPATTNSWGPRLQQHRAQIERAIPAVGRLETTDGEVERVEGTGWLVRSDVVVTNRHIAAVIEPLIASAGARLRIDFAEEDGNDSPAPIGALERRNEFAILDVPYMAPEEALDLAFLRIAPSSASERAVIELGDDPGVGMDVCTIGYPVLRDTIYDPAYFDFMFGEMLGVKRLSPGTVLAYEPWRTTHDCSTVGGSSGSVILDIVSGKAVALNYAEDWPVNYAISARVVRERLAKI